MPQKCSGTKTCGTLLVLLIFPQAPQALENALSGWTLLNPFRLRRVLIWRKESNQETLAPLRQKIPAPLTRFKGTA